MRKYFELNKKYKFEINDIIALIYTACATLGIAGVDATPLFFIGSAIGLVTCFGARRINLVLLNGALFLLNAVNFIKIIF